jgi:hypothetical protein
LFAIREPGFAARLGAGSERPERQAGQDDGEDHCGDPKYRGSLSATLAIALVEIVEITAK